METDIVKEIEALGRIRDRLISTSNEKLEIMLEKLLPKLVALASQEKLIDIVMEILDPMETRISLLHTNLPCIELFNLVRPTSTPFCCDLALKFLDLGLVRLPENTRPRVAVALVETMKCFLEPFTEISNHLMQYVVDLSKEIREILVNEDNSQLKNVIGDWLLDIFITQNEIRSGIAGSIQAGLSEERINRLAFRELFSTPASIRIKKRFLLTNIHHNWLQVPNAVAITLSGFIDNDTELSKESLMKLNYIRNSINLDTATATAIIELLLELCRNFPGKFLSSESPKSIQILCNKRSCLREDLRTEIIKWISKELVNYIQFVNPQIIVSLLSDILLPINSIKHISTKLKSAAFLLANLSEPLFIASNASTNLNNNDSIIAMDNQYQASLLFKMCEKTLSVFASRQTTNNEEDYILKERCYQLLEKLVLHFPPVGLTQRDLPAMLFDLLENEVESLATKLLSAMGALRLLYEKNIAVTSVAVEENSSTTAPETLSLSSSSSSSVSPTVSATSQSQSQSQSREFVMRDMLRRARGSPQPRMRSASLLWSFALYRWEGGTLEVLLRLADDQSPLVSEATKKLFSKLLQQCTSVSSNCDSVGIGSSSSGIVDDRLPIIQYFLSVMSSSSNNVPAAAASTTAGKGGSPILTTTALLPLATIQMMLCLTAFLDNLHNNLPNSTICESSFWKCPDCLEAPPSSSSSPPKKLLLEVILPLLPLSLQGLIPCLDAYISKSNKTTATTTATTSVSPSTSTSLSSSSSLHNTLLYEASKLIRSILLLLATTRDPLSRPATSHLRSTTTPTLLSWLSLPGDHHGRDWETKKALAQSIGLLSLAVSEVTGGEVDASLMQLLRVLQLKISSNDSSTAGALFTLSYVIRYNYLHIHFQPAPSLSPIRSIGNNREKGTVSSDHQLWYSTLQQLLAHIQNILSLAVTSTSGSNHSSSHSNCPHPTNIGHSAEVAVAVAVAIPLASLEALHSLGLSGLLPSLLQESEDTASSFSSISTILEHTTSLVSSVETTPVIRNAAIRAISSLYCYPEKHSLDTQCEEKSLSGDWKVVWELLLSLPMLRVPDNTLRIAIAESALRLACSSYCNGSSGAPPHPPTESLVATVDENSLHHHYPVPVLLLQLIDRVEAMVVYVGTRSSEDIGRERASIGTILLVVLCRIWGNSSPHQTEPLKYPLPPDLPLRLTKLFLFLLKDAGLYLQDVSRSGLCWCYYLATTMSCSKSALAVADEVVTMLMKEKLASVQPVGIAVAGESTYRSAQPGDAEPTNTDTGSAAGTGGGVRDVPETERRMTEALAALAADLGVQIRDAALDAPPRPTGAAGDETAATVDKKGYGVYSVVCKVAKKAHDPSVVFAALSLMDHRDPFLAPNLPPAPSDDPNQLAGSYKEDHYFDLYRAPRIQVDASRLREVIPPLFLSRYDPSPIAKEVMKSLWENIVPRDQKANLVISLEKEILAYLTTALHSRQWRDREAACVALSSSAFIAKRPWKVVKLFVERLWLGGLRALDDIRDTTRAAAVTCMRTLGDHLLAVCNTSIKLSPVDNISSTSSSTSSAHPTFMDEPEPEPSSREEDRQEALDFLLPLLLDRGLMDASPDVRGFSMGMLIKLIKTVEAFLGPRHLPRLISTFVESMSALEPQALAYMQFHTTRLSMSTEELETIRIKMAQQSPMQEALDSCLSSLPPAAIEETVQLLCDSLRRGVGLSTIISAAKSLSMLVHLYPDTLHYTGPLGMVGQRAFRSVLGVVLVPRTGSSDLVTRAVGDATGVLAKCIHPDELTRGCRLLMKHYRDQTEEDVLPESFSATSSLVSYALRQILERSSASHSLLPESLWNDLLLTSYVGKYEKSTSISPGDSEGESAAQSPSAVGWGVVWESCLTNSGAGTASEAMKRILFGVSRDVVRLLRGRSWLMRQHGLEVLRGVIMALTTATTSSACTSATATSSAAVGGGGSESESEKEFYGYLCPIMYTSLLLLKGPVWKGRESVVEVIGEILKKWPQAIDTSLSSETLLVGMSSSSSASELMEDGEGGEKGMVVLVTLNDITRSSESEAEAEAEGGDRTTATSSTGHKDELLGLVHTWYVSVRGLVTILLRECQRGRLEGSGGGVPRGKAEGLQSHRLSAALCLTSLPWESLTAQHPDVFMEFISSIFTRIGYVGNIFLDSAIAGNESEETKSLSDTATATALGSNAKPLSLPKKTLPVKKSNPVDLFGNRYGAVVPAKKSVLRVGGVNRSSSSSSSSASASVSVSVRPTTASPPTVVVVADTPTTATTAATLASEPDSNSNNNNSANTGNLRIPEGDPAVRSKLLECISCGWPADLSASSPPPGGAASLTVLQLTIAARNILSWISRTIDTEAWSVKKSMLAVTGSIMGLINNINDVNIYLSIIAIGLKDVKYTQVRLAAVTSLTRFVGRLYSKSDDNISNVLQETGGSFVLSECKRLLSIALSDSQPLVLAAASVLGTIFENGVFK